MDISFTVRLFVCTVSLRISPPRMKRRQILHGGSSASNAGNLPFWGTVLLQKPKIGRIGQRAGHAHRCSISRDVGSACVDIGQSALTYLFQVVFLYEVYCRKIA